MKLIGQLVNVADPARRDVFNSYVVRVSYLVLDDKQHGNIFREVEDTFEVQGMSDAFHFELPDLQFLNLDSPFAVVVQGAGGAEAFAGRFKWESTLAEQHAGAPLRIEIKGVLPAEPETPVEINGRLVVRGQPEKTTGFSGYKVIASFQAQDALGGPYSPRSSTLDLGDSSRWVQSLPGRERLQDAPVAIDVKFPDGSTAGKSSFSLDALRRPITVEIDVPLTMVLTTDGRAIAAESEKLKGKVVDALGQTQISSRQVILWGRNASGTTSPLLIVSTDPHGNFSGERPKQRVIGAVATVAGTKQGLLPNALPVELSDLASQDHHDDGQTGLLPKFVYLVVDLDEATQSDPQDCDCGPGQPPRQPDAEELVTNSDAYSQDIGANCVNFTTPNRTLEEFSYTMVVRTSEPEIKGTTLSDADRRTLRTRSITELVAKDAASVGASLTKTNLLAKTALPISEVKTHAIEKYGLADMSKSHFALASYLSDLFKTVPGRGALNADNSVDWDSTPTFYQATTIAHGHILYLKQVWKADGYSMGDLLYSLPLAPGQKKQVVVFDWDRTEFGRRDEASHEDEALDSYLGHNRDIVDITSGSLLEHMNGGSNSRTSGSAGGIGGAAGGLFGPVFAGIAGGFSASSGSASSSAWQDSSRNVSAQGLNQLRDMVQQGASAVRNQRSTVVQTARQNERFRVESEVVANHNHCHAITVQYFEVLRHYAIEQKLTAVQECLFVPLLMSEFDEPKVMRWMDQIRPSLRDPGQRNVFRLSTGGLAIRAKPLAAGFDAIERRMNAYEGSDLPNTTYASEKVLDLSGDLTITLSLNRPKDKDDEAADHPIQPVLWQYYSIFSGWTPEYVFNNYFAKRAQQERDRMFEQEIAPRIAEGFVDTLQFIAIDTEGNAYPLDLDATLISTYQRDTPLYVSVRPSQGELPVRRDQIAKLVIATSYDLTQSANSRVIVRSASFRYRTSHFDGVLIRNDAVNNDLKNTTLPVFLGGVTLPTDKVVLYTPLSTEELRNPRQEDKEASLKLLRHLNANIEYYHKVIWANMDPDRRYMLLDGFVAPNSNGKSVASVVENRVIGVAGNSLIMPVAPGYKLDPTYELQPELDAAGEPVTDKQGHPLFKPVDLLDHYKPLTPIPPFRASVPTRGVFAEAVMGACNSCEKKDETRFWRWEESPNPDEPTLINPIQTGTPQRSDPGDLKATPFPAPMINIQNAPAAPDPGSTLGGALGLLGKSDLFRDITGLEQTQKNALQAMLSNEDSAKHYADKAAELATLAANQRNGNSTVENIKKSMDDGTIDRDTGKKLIEDVYRAQISGKPASDQPVNTANNSQLSKAAADAVSQGRDVKAVQNHPDGTQTSVEQKASSPSSTSAPALSVTLQKPDPNAADKWINIPTGEGPGFAKFDRAFNASGHLLPDYPDKDSGRFRISIVDADPLASGPREVKWQVVFDEAGGIPVNAMADTTISLTSELSTPSLFVSKPLVLVHEKEDLPGSISSGSGASARPGDKNYRARLAGMFTSIVIDDAGRKNAFPVLAPSQRRGVPVQIFLLKLGSTLSIPHAELGDRLAEVQRVYEPHGIFLNAHPYNFSSAQTAKYKPVPFTVGTAVPYVCTEIDVTGILDPSLLTETAMEQLGIDLSPNPGGPAIRIFFLGDFAVNHTVPAPKDLRIALAFNRSFVNEHSLSSVDKQKLMFSLMCAGRAQPVLFPYVVAHEFGHLLMDKFASLGAAAPNTEFRHHFNPPATPGYPLNQNLMRPQAGKALRIDAPKRIWDIEDADKYNQLKDLRSNVQKLQIGP
jgi:hypothetical protein